MSYMCRNSTSQKFPTQTLWKSLKLLAKRFLFKWENVLGRLLTKDRAEAYGPNLEMLLKVAFGCSERMQFTPHTSGCRVCRGQAHCTQRRVRADLLSISKSFTASSWLFQGMYPWQPSAIALHKQQVVLADLMWERVLWPLHISTFPLNKPAQATHIHCVDTIDSGRRAFFFKFSLYLLQ